MKEDSKDYGFKNETCNVPSEIVKAQQEEQELKDRARWILALTQDHGEKEHQPVQSVYLNDRSTNFVQQQPQRSFDSDNGDKSDVQSSVSEVIAEPVETDDILRENGCVDMMKRLEIIADRLNVLRSQFHPSPIEENSFASRSIGSPYSYNTDANSNGRMVSQQEMYMDEGPIPSEADAEGQEMLLFLPSNTSDLKTDVLHRLKLVEDNLSLLQPRPCIHGTGGKPGSLPVALSSSMPSSHGENCDVLGHVQRSTSFADHPIISVHDPFRNLRVRSPASETATSKTLPQAISSTLKSPKRAFGNQSCCKQGVAFAHERQEIKCIKMRLSQCNSIPFPFKKKLNLDDLDLNQEELDYVFIAMSWCFGKSLHTLNLAGNKRLGIPENLSCLAVRLSSLTALKSLDLSNCSLCDFPVEQWSLPHLTSLNLGSNCITDFPSMSVLSGLPRLRKLDLHRNQIREISPLLESKESEKEYLLSELSIARPMKKGTSERTNKKHLVLSSLEYLNVSSNQIHTLPDDMGQGFPSLKILDVSDNFLEEIPCSLHCEMKALWVVITDGNPLHESEFQILGDMESDSATSRLKDSKLHDKSEVGGTKPLPPAQLQMERVISIKSIPEKVATHRVSKQRSQSNKTGLFRKSRNPQVQHNTCGRSC